VVSNIKQRKRTVSYLLRLFNLFFLKSQVFLNSLNIETNRVLDLFIILFLTEQNVGKIFFGEITGIIPFMAFTITD